MKVLHLVAGNLFVGAARDAYGLETPWEAKVFSLMSNGFWNRDSRKLLMALSVGLVAASLGRTLKSDEVDAVVAGLSARHQ